MVERSTTVQRELIKKAILKQHVDILEVLLSDYDETYKDILAPYLELAAKEGMIKIARILINHGAEVTDDVIKIAREHGHSGTSVFLAKMRAKNKKK